MDGGMTKTLVGEEKIDTVRSDPVVIQRGPGGTWK